MRIDNWVVNTLMMVTFATTLADCGSAAQFFGLQK